VHHPLETHYDCGVDELQAKVFFLFVSARLSQLEKRLSKWLKNVLIGKNIRFF
jgi:hypothetical protein